MKITLVYGAVPGNDYGLLHVMKIIRKTFEELGENIGDINLIHEDIPFFDGEASQAMQKHISELQKSDGVIFAFTTCFSAPSAIMQNFFEYLSYKAFSSCLKDKNIFVVTSSRTGGEADSLNYAGKLVRHLGGYDAVRLGLNQSFLRDIEQNTELRENIEKYAEDYYRAVRQNRKFILPSDSFAAPYSAFDEAASHDDYEQLVNYGKKEEVTLEDLEEKYKLNDMSQQQEEDVLEITQFFAGKYKEDFNITPNSNRIPAGFKKAAPPPRAKTVRQMTQSLPHYFQPQFSAGLNAAIQINITGSEAFESCLSITNLECDYQDGASDSPDLTIMCDTGVWTDILKGKYSAQKAFMIGHLKVRGNFVLLTKFDQMFKPQS